MLPVIRRLSALALAAALAACAGAGAPGGGDATGPVTAESSFGAYLAGRFARSSYDNEAAAAFFQQALAEDDEDPILKRRALAVFLAAGRMEQAEQVARRVVTVAPEEGLAHLMLAAADLRRQDFAGALARVEATGRSGLNILLSPLFEAWAQAGAGRADAALQALAPLSANPAFASLQLHTYHQALLQDFMGRPEAADRAFRDLLGGAGGGTMRAIEAYGSFLARSGRARDATSLYDQYLARNPEAPTIVAARAALPAASTRIAGTPAEGAAEGLYTAGAVLSREDLGELVEIYLQLALYLSPRLDAARMLLGDLYETRQRWSDAEKVYAAVAAASPYADTARLRQGWAVRQQDRIDEAAAIFRTEAARQRGRVEPLMMLGDMLRGRERWLEAAVAYTDAIARLGQLREQHWAVFYSRGVVHERSGQWPLAEADFLKSLELSPDQPLTLNYLGYTWVDRGERLIEARRMIERAVELRPNDGFIIDSLGWALYRLGRFPEAVVHLERAVELEPDDPVINDHLGDAYWRVGRTTEARFQWQRSLGLKPEAKAREVTERKLLEGLPPAPPSTRQAENNSER